MYYKKTMAALTAMMMLNGCVVVANTHGPRVELDRQLALSASDLQQLSVDAGAGSLNIRGEEGATEIRVMAHIETTESDEPLYELTLEREGRQAKLVAKHKPVVGVWVGNSPSIDLDVVVPKHFALDIDDGSGSISVRDIGGDAEISDGSGSIEVKSLGGRLEIEDGSGGIDAVSIAGAVEIDDGSGPIALQQVGGAVNIDDNSGSIVARQLAGSLKINDGSGDIDVEQVAGHVSVDDGSGDIHVRDAGSLTIIEAGSGGLKIDQIHGEVNIDD